MYAKRGYISDGTGVWYKDKLCEQYSRITGRRENKSDPRLNKYFYMKYMY